MRRIEAQSPEIAEGATKSSFVTGPEGIATILDKPKVMRFTDAGQFTEIERIAQCVRQHNRAGTRSDGVLNSRWIDVVGWYININEHGHKVITEHRIDCRRESRCNRDDLITWNETAVSEFGRG